MYTYDTEWYYQGHASVQIIISTTLIFFMTSIDDNKKFDEIEFMSFNSNQSKCHVISFVFKRII